MIDCWYEVFFASEATFLFFIRSIYLKINFPVLYPIVTAGKPTKYYLKHDIDFVIESFLNHIDNFNACNSLYAS